MNRIIIEKDNIKYNKKNNKKDIIIKDKEITINKSGEYIIEYINCKNNNLTFNIEKDIKVEITEYGVNQKIKNDITYNLNDYSNLTIYKFYNNKELEEKIVFNLNKQYSKINYHFSNICSYKQKYHLIINHNASFTDSNITNKSMNTNDADLTFTVDSNLPKGSVKCNLIQESRVITEKDNNAKIEPNMFIEEDDVSAKHGSVIGTFNEDELFYLMSRGIPERDSLKLLIQGLIFSNLKINSDIRTKILNIINEKWR